MARQGQSPHFTNPDSSSSPNMSQQFRRSNWNTRSRIYSKLRRKCVLLIKNKRQQLVLFKNVQREHSIGKSSVLQGGLSVLFFQPKSYYLLQFLTMAWSSNEEHDELSLLWKTKNIKHSHVGFPKLWTLLSYITPIFKSSQKDFFNLFLTYFFKLNKLSFSLLF